MRISFKTYPISILTKIPIFGILLLISFTVSSQEMSFEEYNPPSTLVVPEHPVSRAKYPFIDIHSPVECKSGNGPSSGWRNG
jgi:hypothetical protein